MKNKILEMKNSLEGLNSGVDETEEQQEEEANAQKLVEKYHLFGKTADGLYELNKEFGKRD